MLQDAPLLQNKWTKILPHYIDSTLLGSAILMLITLHLSVFEQSWLVAKIIALLVYIALGMLTLKDRYAKSIRASAWVMGLVVFMYIASVALSKNPYGFLYWLNQ